MSAKLILIPGHYNPSEEVTNINKIYKLYFTKLKTSITRMNIKIL